MCVFVRMHLCVVPSEKEICDGVQQQLIARWCYSSYTTCSHHGFATAPSVAAKAHWYKWIAKFYRSGLRHPGQFLSFCSLLMQTHWHSAGMRYGRALSERTCCIAGGQHQVPLCSLKLMASVSLPQPLKREETQSIFTSPLWLF